MSFYRPHKRVVSDGRLEKIDPKTGEVIRFKPPARTKQAHVAECDINNILKQYLKTGMVRHVSQRAEMGAYADLPDQVDFQDSLNTVIRAQNVFADLPSKLRSRFGNDPREFLEFMANPDNQDEAIKLGLVTDKRPPPIEETPPTKVIVVSSENDKKAGDK